MQTMKPAVEVLNFKSGDVIGYPLPILKCRITAPTQDIGLIRITNTNLDVSTNWRLSRNKTRFHAPIQLKLGCNEIYVCLCRSKWRNNITKLQLIYEIPDQCKIIRPTLITFAPDSTTVAFDDFSNCNLRCLCQKIVFSSLLIQSFYAEQLYENGFNRKTFRLDLNSRGDVQCRVFRSRLRRRDAAALREAQLWRYLHNELFSSDAIANKGDTKVMAFVAGLSEDEDDGFKREKVRIPHDHPFSPPISPAVSNFPRRRQSGATQLPVSTPTAPVVTPIPTSRSALLSKYSTGCF